MNIMRLSKLLDVAQATDVKRRIWTPIDFRAKDLHSANYIKSCESLHLSPCLSAHWTQHCAAEPRSFNY